ncbi:hypothetical protein DF3PB_880004 [uncultured Defluviicoccus sp.]|uniref:Uncharacterized protein n=1 Tax=metagenome TaxID=256318 RepID=A0A380TJY8_9ZZZZ|nr:hypothetical protein DF3PB_880004 [uncultured Defluviicoccus sp.]
MQRERHAGTLAIAQILDCYGLLYPKTWGGDEAKDLEAGERGG